LVVSDELPELLAPGRQMLRRLNFEGFRTLSSNAIPGTANTRSSEVNARHNLSAILAVRCGVNFPLLAVSAPGPRERLTQSPCRQGVYWVDISRDVRMRCHICAGPKYTVAGSWGPTWRRMWQRLWDARDPGPAVARARYSVKALRGWWPG